MSTAAKQSQMVKVEVIADIFGMTTRRVRQLEQEGIIEARKVKGHAAALYPLEETIKKYITHLQFYADKRGRLSEDLKVVQLEEQQLKVRKLDAQVALMEGRAHSAAAVEIVMGDMLTGVRTRLRVLPMQAAPLVAEAEDETAIAQILLQAIDETLQVLSDYNAEAFNRRNPEFIGELDDEDDPTDEFEDDQEAA